MKKILSLLKNRLFIYAFIGGLCAFIDLGVFYILNLILGLSLLIVSNTLSILTASTVKFFLNKRFTFRNNSAKVKHQYVSSLIVLGIYIIFTSASLYLFVNIIGVNEIISKVIVLFLGLPVNYLLDKKITFGLFN